MSDIAGSVAALLLFQLLVPQRADPRKFWLTLAMASTLAGNLEALEPAANLIVVQRVLRQVVISFGEYFRVGLPVTIPSIAIGILLMEAL